MIMTEPVRAALTFLASRDSQAVYVPSVAGVAQSLDQAEGQHTTIQVPVHNARLLEDPPTLGGQGFELVEHVVKDVTDFYDDAQIQSTYHDQIKELLLTRLTRATRVEIFDDTRRSACSDTRMERKMREPSANVHNDYTQDSGVWRLEGFLKEHYPDENIDELMKRPWCIVNVWRSISGTVENWPLVLCDQRTVCESDVVSVERKAANGRKGEIQMAVHNPQHQWYYFPRLNPNEALLFKTFDSTQPSRTIHSSFDDPTAPSHAAPRESIETRCFVFY